MNVYTFYTDINRLALPVIELWKKSWSEHGWTPIVLGEDDFKKWVGADAYDASVSKLPTVNNTIYEQACYRRWGAMVQAGGGILTDYDVQNYGFTPDDLPCDIPGLLVLDRNSPSVVVGTAEQFQAACDLFAAYKPTDKDNIKGVPHVSDMHICNNACGGGLFRRQVICEEYRDAGWDEAPLVHFASFKCRGRKQDEIERAKHFHTSFIKKKRLSIVIPEFKRFELFTAATRHNCQYWKNPDIEVILVKDHPDRDADYVDFCENRSGVNLKIIRNPNDHEWRNPSAVINVGIRAAVGEFVLVHSPETVYVGDVPSQFLAVAKQGEVICGQHTPAQADEFYASATPTELVTRLESAGRKSMFSGSVCAPRLDLFTIAGYDERIKGWGYDDLNLRARLETLGSKVRHFTSIQLVHIGHDNPVYMSFPELLSNFISLPQQAAWTTADSWGRDFNDVIYQSET